MFPPNLLGMAVECSFDGRLPGLLPCGITVHDLLRVEFNDFLETDDDDLSLDGAEHGWEEPGRKVLVYPCRTTAIEIEGADPPSPSQSG